MALKVAKSGRVGGGLENCFQGFRLELKDAVVVDEALLVERLGFGAQRLEDFFAFGSAVDVLDPQIDDVAKTARRGVVGRGLVGQGRGLRAERVEKYDGGAVAARPAAEASQVGEVADAPAVI